MNKAKESSMKKAVVVTTLGVIGLASAGVTSAQEVGRVISSTPVVQQVPVSRQVCGHQPMAVQPQQSSGGGALVGAIVGGILGNQIGHGMGRAAATGVGLIAGAAVGDNLERRTDPYGNPVAHCTTQTTYENRTVGYNVQYEYGGKTFDVQMAQDPGPTIPLQIQPMASAAPQQFAPQALAPHDGVQTAIHTQPMVVQQAPSVVYPAYGYPGPHAYPIYHTRPYYAAPPVSFSFGYIHHGGHRHRHRHWRH